MRSALRSSINSAATAGSLTAPQPHHPSSPSVFRRRPAAAQHLRPRSLSTLSAVAAFRTTSLLLLALVALATLSATAEAGYHGRPAHQGRPPCTRYNCMRTQPATFIDLQVMLDLHACPGLQLEVFVATAVVAADQARRVCPGGRRTALNQVQVAVAVEAKVELGVVVQNRRGKVLGNLIVVLDLLELAVVRDNVALVEISVEIDVELQVMRFMCGDKEVYVTKVSVAVMASLVELPGRHN